VVGFLPIFWKTTDIIKKSHFGTQEIKKNILLVVYLGRIPFKA